MIFFKIHDGGRPPFKNRFWPYLIYPSNRLPDFSEVLRGEAVFFLQNFGMVQNAFFVFLMQFGLQRAKLSYRLRYTC